MLNSIYCLLFIKVIYLFISIMNDVSWWQEKKCQRIAVNTRTQLQGLPL